MIEVVDQPDVRPMVGDADQFDAVAAVGRGGGLELRLQQRDGLVRGVRAQRVVERGRQPGRLVRRIVPGEIGDAEGREHGCRRERAARRRGVAPARARRSRLRQIRRPTGSAAPALCSMPTRSASPTAIAISTTAIAISSARCHRRGGGIVAGQPAVHEIARDQSPAARRTRRSHPPAGGTASRPAARRTSDGRPACICRARRAASAPWPR